jgi:ATP adenylyltransferase
MDHLWTPWRYQYIAGRTESAAVCIFCSKPAENRDVDNYIVHRGAACYALLNLYPYTSGHLVVAPFDHVATLEEAAEKTLEEMIRLTRLAEQCLRAVYRPEGVNIGMNIGKCAGAGVAGHIHMHVLPRWTGDASFMTTVGETRVLPEDLETTYRKLSAAFRELPDPR